MEAYERPRPYFYLTGFTGEIGRIGVDTIMMMAQLESKFFDRMAQRCLSPSASVER